MQQVLFDFRLENGEMKEESSNVNALAKARYDVVYPYSSGKWVGALNN